MSGNIFELRVALADAIVEYQGGRKVFELCEGNVGLFEAMERLENQLQGVARCYEEEDVKELRVLNRVTLHVSNDCNLRCSYCYALGGNYGYAKGYMDRQTAIDVVNFLCEQFDVVRHVVFFGGEPLLNLPAISTVCEQFEIAHGQGRIAVLPHFGVITNGTIHSDEAIGLIRDRLSFVTVSLDGPEEIHDFNRKRENGRGSYADVDQFIKRVKSETSVTLRFEGTISKEHRKRKIMGFDMQAFARSEYGISGSVATDILTDDRRHIDREFLEAGEEEEKILGVPRGYFYDTGVELLLSGLVHRAYREMCEVQSKELDALIAALVKTKRDPEAWEGLKAFLQSAEEYSC